MPKIVLTSQQPPEPRESIVKFSKTKETLSIRVLRKANKRLFEKIR